MLVFGYYCTLWEIRSIHGFQANCLQEVLFVWQLHWAGGSVGFTSSII